MHPIAYASRCLSRSEKNHPIWEQETLAAVYGISQFRHYLYGQKFRIMTDHHGLCYLHKCKDPVGRLARYVLKLEEYQYEIVYKSGKLHLDADALSRAPISPHTQEDEIAKEIPMLTMSQEEIAKLQKTDSQ